MATYVITNRTTGDQGYGASPEPNGALHFLIAPQDYTSNPALFQEETEDTFKTKLLATLNGKRKDNQRAQLLIFVHGYNTSYTRDLQELSVIGRALEGAGFQGLVIGFSWPSEGNWVDYLQDRDRARESVTGFVHAMHLLRAERRPPDQCFVEVAVLSHSMGNYLLRESLRYFHKHIGYPASEIYFAQVLMVAADIAWDSLEKNGTGQAIWSLSHRVTFYYSIHDDILGYSKWLKHFGQRRLGRSGPEDYGDLPGNVVGVDCSHVATPQNAANTATRTVHSCYWYLDQTVADFVATLSGQDRGAIPKRQEIATARRRGYVIV